jgi:hypothetical protein
MLTRILNHFGYIRLETAENWVSIKNKRIAQQQCEIEALFNRCNKAQRRASLLCQEGRLLRAEVETLRQSGKTKVITNARKEH